MVVQQHQEALLSRTKKLGAPWLGRSLVSVAVCWKRDSDLGPAGGPADDSASAPTAPAGAQRRKSPISSPRWRSVRPPTVFDGAIRHWRRKRAALQDRSSVARAGERRPWPSLPSQAAGPEHPRSAPFPRRAPSSVPPGCCESRSPAAKPAGAGRESSPEPDRSSRPPPADSSPDRSLAGSARRLRER